MHQKFMVYGIGLVVTGHYVLAGYGDPRALDDQLQPPPLAAVVATTSTDTGVSTVSHGFVNPITDDQYGVSFERRPLITWKSS